MVEDEYGHMTQVRTYANGGGGETYYFQKYLAVSRAKADITLGDHVRPTPWWGYTLTAVPGVSDFISGRYRYETEPHYGGPFTSVKYFNQFSHGSPCASQYSSDHQGLLAQKCLDRISKGTYDFGSELAELDETVNYVAKRLETAAWAFIYIIEGSRRGLTRLFGKPKRRYKMDARSLKKVLGSVPQSVARRISLRSARTSAQLWLEYRYAIMPIVYSVEDAVSVYNDGLEIRAGNYFSVWDSIKEMVADRELYPNPSGDETVSVTGANLHRMKLSGRIIDPKLHLRDGLGLNQATMLIERIPFSFVLEWSLDVSGMLRALSAYNNVTYSHGYQSVKQDQILFVSKKTNGTTRWGYRLSAYRRWTLLNLPIPTIQFKNPFDTQAVARSLDLVSLALVGSKIHPVVN